MSDSIKITLIFAAVILILFGAFFTIFHVIRRGLGRSKSTVSEVRKLFNDQYSDPIEAEVIELGMIQAPRNKYLGYSKITLGDLAFENVAFADMEKRSIAKVFCNRLDSNQTEITIIGPSESALISWSIRPGQKIKIRLSKLSLNRGVIDWNSSDDSESIERRILLKL